MTGLYLVKEEAVPVEDVKPRMRVLLPGGGVVAVQRVDVYDTLGAEAVENFVVRWCRSPKDLGSLRPMLRGETVRVDRG